MTASLASYARFGNYYPTTFGWPAGIPKLVPFSFQGVNFGQCAADVLGVFQAVLTELVPHIPGGIAFGPADDWSFSATDDLPDGTWSFHHRGLAFDLNWRENPMGAYTRNPFAGRRGAIPHAIASAIARKYGCEYGGDWHGFKDYMHFECHLPPAISRRVQPYSHSPANPNWSDMASKAEVQAACAAAVAPIKHQVEGIASLFLGSDGHHHRIETAVAKVVHNAPYTVEHGHPGATYPACTTKPAPAPAAHR